MTAAWSRGMRRRWNQLSRLSPAVIGRLPASDCRPSDRMINVLVGSHLTPADVNELKEIVDSFGMKAIMLPDLSALDGSRQGFSPLAAGGTTVEGIEAMGGCIVHDSLGIEHGAGGKAAAAKVRHRVPDIRQ